MISKKFLHHRFINRKETTEEMKKGKTRENGNSVIAIIKGRANDGQITKYMILADFIEANAIDSSITTTLFSLLISSTKTRFSLTYLIGNDRPIFQKVEKK